MQQNFKFLYILIFFLPLFVISFTDNFLVLWIMMEIQTILFSSIIWLHYSNKSFILSFMVIQLISGILLLMLWSFQHLMYSLELSSVLTNIVLFFKMGVFPFQSWGMAFCKNLYYMDLFIFLSAMKFFPFFFLFYSNYYITLVLLLFNMGGSLFYLNYVNSYKLIIFFSSTVSSMFFLLFLLHMGLMMSFFFLLFYLIFLFVFVKEMNYTDLDFIFSGKTMFNILFAFLFVFSLTGVPFSTGFIMKTMILKLYFNSMLANLFYFFVYLTSLVFSFFYMKVLFFLMIVLGKMWTSSAMLKMEHKMEMLPFFFILYSPISLSLFFFIWYSSLF